MALEQSPRICPIMIGRDDELVRGAHLLTRAAAGQGTLLLVMGEAGAGKSRLVRALRETATWRGFRTLFGMCEEHDRSYPYAPFLDAFRDLLHRDDMHAMIETARLHCGALARLLPDLATSDALPPAVLPPENEKRRIFEAFVHLLIRLSDDAPLLLVLEDLHWADDTSIALVQLLARRLKDAPILALATTRTDEPGSGLDRWLTLLRRNRLVTLMELSLLTDADVTRMIAATLDQPAPRAIAAAIQERAEGNPFLVEELLHRYFNERGEWRHDEDAPTASPHVPAVVAETITRRLERMNATARAVAEIAAVIGRRFSFDLLRMVSGLDETALIAALRALVAAQLVVEDVEATGRVFRFRHALTRDAVYGGLLGPERRRWHRAIVQVLAAAEAAGSALSDGEMGYHAFVAEEWQAALEHCARAGDQAQTLYTPQAAIEHFSRALIAAERLGALPTDLLLRRGAAYEWGGDLARARRDYETALAAARGAADRSAQWHALMLISTSWGVRDHPQSIRYAQDALALARAMDDAAATAHSLNRLGIFAIFADLPFEAQRYHEQALTIFQSLGDARGIAETLERLGYARVFGADLVGSTRDFQEALERHTKLDDRRGMVYSLVGMSERSATLWTDWMAPATLRIVDAMPEGERAWQLARASGWRVGETYSLAFLAVCIGAEGDYTRALRWAHDALAIAEEIGSHGMQFLAHGALSFLYLDLIASPLATRHLNHALALAQRLGSRHYLEGTIATIVRLHLVRGEVAQAAAVLHEHFPSDPPPQTFQQRHLWLAKAELALAQGDAARALQIAEQLIETAPNIETVAGRGIPRIDKVRGEALTAMGWHARAEEVLRTAQRTAQEQGARPLLWRLHAALGALYHRMRRHTDAAREYAAAQHLIEELAATVPDDHTRGTFTRHAFAMIPRAYYISARRVAKERYGGLTRREREVVARIAAGKTNREIAADLFIAEKTVELHVSNSLRKLDRRTRAELAAWAVASGLMDGDADERTAIP